MTLAVRLSVGFILAAGLAFLATPYAIRLAGRLQFFDKPAGYKGHAQPTPYLGGLAVMGALVAAVAASAGSWDKSGPLLAGVIVLCAVGTLDDRRSLAPLARVLVELALAVMVWATGLGWHLHAGGAVDLGLTCLWVLGVVNAFNLFDNMDGAASTMALVVASGVALIGVVRGEVWLAASAACMCGACVGFLPRNMAVPARIFLGDGGSMPIGFVVAVLVTGAAGTSSVAWRSLLVALLLVGIPVLDTSLVIVSRRRRGVSVLRGGRDHLTHRALRMLGSARAVALVLGAIQAAVSVVAVLASRGEASLVVIGASAYLLIAGCAIIALDTQKIEEIDDASEPPRPRLGKRAFALLIVLGLGSGLSPFFFTYYDTSAWVPIALGVTIVCAIGLGVRPLRPAAPAALAIGGLLGLGVWSLISTAWAESVENAVVSGNRWLAYGALLMLMVLLVSHDRRALVLLAAAAVGIGAVGVSVLVRLLGDDPGGLFLAGRLNSPLGYINGEGCLFAMALWPCAALLEHRRAAVAGAAAAAATAFASLALLSQSRGTALAILGSVLVVLAVVPGRTRRAYGLIVVAGAVALAGADLLRVYDHRFDARLPAHVGHAAGVAILLSAALAGIVWALACGGWSRLRADGALAARLRRGATAALLVPVVVALVAGVASAGRVEREVRTQWHAFIRLTEPGERSRPSSANQSRLLSGGGNRYDYWRIAWNVWRDHPIGGTGAGNFVRPYYERRATTEDVDQPHSIWLQALSELGLVGLLALAAFVGGVAWGAARLRRAAVVSPVRRGLLTTSLGMFTAWLVQASVDWMALLPGLTGIALAAASALTWPRAAPVEVTAPEGEPATAPVAGRRGRGAIAVAAVTVTLIATGASLSREGLAEVYRTRAQHELARNPALALRDANRSLGIDPDAVATYYAKAAALARFDQAPAAEAALRAALAREPHNFVTWALLGDISVRLGDRAGARDYYARARTLNPRDPTLVPPAAAAAAGVRQP